MSRKSSERRVFDSRRSELVAAAVLAVRLARVLVALHRRSLTRRELLALALIVVPLTVARVVVLVLALASSLLEVVVPPFGGRAGVSRLVIAFATWKDNPTFRQRFFLAVRANPFFFFFFFLLTLEVAPLVVGVVAAVVVVLTSLVVARGVRTVRQGLGFGVNVATFALQVDNWPAGGGCLLLHVGLLELLDGLDGEFVKVVEEVLSESVAFEQAQAPVWAAFTELRTTEHS